MLNVKSRVSPGEDTFLVECLITSEVGVLRSDVLRLVSSVVGCDVGIRVVIDADDTLMSGVCIPDARFRSLKTQENDLMT